MFRVLCGITALTIMSSAAGAGDTPLKSLEDGLSSVCLVGRWNEYTGLYSDVWGDGDYAYLPNWGADGRDGRVHILDVSNPASPQLASTFFLPSPNQFASPQDVKVANGLLYIALESDANDGVAIVDVRDPTDPTLLATVRVPGYESTHNVFVDNGYLYIPEGTTVAIVDLTSFDPDNPPPSPITVAKWIITGIGTSFVHDVTVENGRLYAAAWDSGLWVYNVSDVANSMPTLMGSVGGNNTHSMWPTDDGQYVVTGEERGGGGITVYRMTETAGSIAFAQTDSLSLPDSFSVHNQFFIGNRLYNSWYEQGLQIFDINLVTGVLELVGSYDTSNTGIGNWGIYPLLGTDRILLSDANEGLFIVNEQCDCLTASPPTPETIEDVVSRKNRFLSFSVGDVGREQAVRVTFLSLPPPFDQWNGQSLWVSEPMELSENGASVGPLAGFPNFNASTLQCDGPVFMDWSVLGTIHVYHEGVVPGGQFRVDVIDSSCPDLSSITSYSDPLEIGTADWGDTLTDLTVDPPRPADDDTTILDVLGIVQAFISDSGAISKARADLEPGCLDALINISDAVSALTGFQGLTYPFDPSAADACDSTCDPLSP